MSPVLLYTIFYLHECKRSKSSVHGEYFIFLGEATFHFFNFYYHLGKKP